MWDPRPEMGGRGGADWENKKKKKRIIQIIHKFVEYIDANFLSLLRSLQVCKIITIPGKLAEYSVGILSMGILLWGYYLPIFLLGLK